MARPSKSDFEKYDPSTLTGRADALQTIVDGLGHGADDSETAQKNARNGFQGTAADALDAMATKDISSMRQFHDAVEVARKAYAGGAAKLTPSVTGVRDVLQDVQQQGFNVLDDWQLQDTKRPGTWRAQAQEGLQHRLDGAVTALDQADEEVASDIAKADQALWNVPYPSFGTSTPEQPAPQPNQPRPDDHPQDRGQPGDHMPGANGKPGDPGYVVPKAAGDTAEYPSEKGWKSDVPGADNPPGYPPVGPGAQRDQNWKDYLKGKNPDGSMRTQGQIPAAYPNPESVGDKGLKVIGAAARQQGTRYVWGGGSPNGVTQPGTRDGGYADQRRDFEHKGFDCSGLSEYSIYQATGIDPGKGSATQLDNQQASGAHAYGHVVAGPNAGSVDESQLQPGDVIYYGNGGSQHVAIYVGDGVTVETNTSGTPAHFQNRPGMRDGTNPITVVRPNS